MYGIGLGIVRGITVLLLCAQLFACSQPPDDETRLRQAIRQMEKAAENHQIRPVLAYLADDFQANGHYHKTDIAGLLSAHYYRNPQVHVFLHIRDIKLSGDRAQLGVEVLLAGGDKQSLPKRVRALVIQSSWQKRDDSWQVLRARWRDPLLQP